MSKGKYSPTLTRQTIGVSEYNFNCYGKVPATWDEEVAKTNEYDEKVHFGNYDQFGFDRYGYSAFDKDGNYIGIGSGVDRNGYTEIDYLLMSDEEFDEKT